MNKVYRPAFKTHGGKYFLSKWIIEQFPTDYDKMVYFEPCAGGGSVLLNKSPGPMEAINDIDPGIVQIFRALRDEPKYFINKLKKIKVTESTFNRAKHKELEFDDYMDHAVNEFILRRMSRGGLKQSFNSDEENVWHNIIKELPRISKRLENVRIFNKQASEVIKAFDDDSFLCYFDPPEISENSSELQMSASEHIELSDILRQFRGKVIVSAYPTKLYKRIYDGWRCIKKKYPNRKTECLWVNY